MAKTPGSGQPVVKHDGGSLTMRQNMRFSALYVMATASANIYNWMHNLQVLFVFVLCNNFVSTYPSW